MLIFLLIFLILILVNRGVVIDCTINSTIYWFKYIFPSLYIILILSDLILYVSKNKNGLFIFYLLSIIIGCPGNAKILSNYDINKKDKTIILASSSYMGPLFILNIFSGMPKLFFISYYIANIFITIMFFKPLKLKVVNNYDNVFIKNVNILLQILGVIIFINIIYNLLNEIFNIPNIIYPFIEISLGSMYIDNMYIAMLALIFLGISIQFQIYNILKYNYFIFIIIRIIIGTLALFLIYFFKYIIFIMLIMIICCIIKFRILFKKIRGNSYVCI